MGITIGQKKELAMSGECDKCGHHTLECMCKQLNPYRERSKLFSIDAYDDVAVFNNHSKFNILLDLVPEKPKRKRTTFHLIPSMQFTVLDFPLDFTKISIRFEE